MLKKDDCLRIVKNFRAKHGLEATDENVIATIHLMNTHGIDDNAALDQSSRSSNDHGIDAWYYDETNRELFIYQSKLTESKALALHGFGDLDSARQWIEQVMVDGAVSTVPSDNHCLFNLYTRLSQVREIIRKVSFILVSPFEGTELEDSPEYQNFERELAKSSLYRFIQQRPKGKLDIGASHYDLEHGISSPTVYSLSKIPNTRVDLRNNAHLDLAYVSLYSLVELYRRRGNVLFDKNVRLLLTSKEARERLVHPMENTLDLITSGKLKPGIFPFYHIGVTISASSSTSEDNNLLNLEAPSIINGCQTINIANEYLERLKKQKNSDEAIARFKQIIVIAKVVVGTTNEELKEITNSNNRQNPIENWQLFSNEPIHIEIETTLKEVGIFYERQQGKFDSVMKNADNAKHYYATNGTYLKVVDLGQLIALSRHKLQWAAKPDYLQWAAKPSEIFLNKENHDKIFDHSIPNYPRDIIFVSNLYKAMKRGLNLYLELPTYANSYAPIIFKKPILRAHVYYLALLYFYQNEHSLCADFSSTLSKKASPKLVEELQRLFYPKVMAKIKNWYAEESKDFTVEISKKKMEKFFADLGVELGVDDTEGPVPFSSTSINWDE